MIEALVEATAEQRDGLSRADRRAFGAFLSERRSIVDRAACAVLLKSARRNNLGGRRCSGRP